MSNTMLKEELTREYLIKANPQLDVENMSEENLDNLRNYYMLSVSLEEAVHNERVRVPIEVFEYKYLKLFLPNADTSEEERNAIAQRWLSEVVGGDPMRGAVIVNGNDQELMSIPPMYDTGNIGMEPGKITKAINEDRVHSSTGVQRESSLRSLMGHIDSNTDTVDPWESFNQYYGVYKSTAQAYNDNTTSLLD